MSPLGIESLQTLKQSATEELKLKHYSNAVVYYNHILKDCTELINEGLITEAEDMKVLIQDLQVPAYKNVALCYLKSNRPARCLEYCEKVLEIEPNNVKILYRAGMANYELGKFEEA